MSRNYTVQTKIDRPVADVFDAVVSSTRMQHYFVNGASGDLVKGSSLDQDDLVFKALGGADAAHPIKARSQLFKMLLQLA